MGLGGRQLNGRAFGLAQPQELVVGCQRVELALHRQWHVDETAHSGESTAQSRAIRHMLLPWTIAYGELDIVGARLFLRGHFI